jgi:hypothetical protein
MPSLDVLRKYLAMCSIASACVLPSDPDKTLPLGVLLRQCQVESISHGSSVVQ